MKLCESETNDTDIFQTTDSTGKCTQDNWKNNKDMLHSKIPEWEYMRELQHNINAWCYINYHFLPSVVGRCMWVAAIQQQAKLRSLTTPSDEAFCLLILKNNWELWVWECHNPGASPAYKKLHAPNVLYTSTGHGRRTVEYGGWSHDGIMLYKTLVDELTRNREKLDSSQIEMENGAIQTKMDFLDNAFLYWAKVWDVKKTLRLEQGAKSKRQKTTSGGTVRVVQIFGWKDKAK